MTTPEQKAREIADRMERAIRLEHLAPDIDQFEKSIATAIREARNSALEEAAGVAKAEQDDPDRHPYSQAEASRIAIRVLALKDKPARDIPEVTEEGGA